MQRSKRQTDRKERRQVEKKVSYSAQRRGGKERRQVGESIQRERGSHGVTEGGQVQRRSKGRERTEEQGRCSHQI